ncbi:MAG: hypothetical protein RL748_3444 [Pseudomonadota bacterium]
MVATDKCKPGLGLGLGLRNCHFDAIVQGAPGVDWFEAISENFMDSHGRPRAMLAQIAERYPIVLHGVSLSIGSTDALDLDYLRKLKALANQVRARWVSDHLCWSSVQGVHAHDLLPLPLNETTLRHVTRRVLQVQDLLERPLVLENPSTYLSFTDSTMSEPEFLRHLTAATGCQFLLDVNNVYVTCFNNDLDPFDYLQQFPMQQVLQFHLAGHQHCGSHIIDTHDRPVADAVWQLFRQAWAMRPDTATLLEWDGNIPALEVCLAELNKARQFMQDGFVPALPDGTDKTLEEPLSTPLGFMVPDVMQNVRMSA